MTWHLQLNVAPAEEVTNIAIYHFFSNIIL